jgi:hypothetical protein
LALSLKEDIDLTPLPEDHQEDTNINLPPEDLMPTGLLLEDLTPTGLHPEGLLTEDIDPLGLQGLQEGKDLHIVLDLQTEDQQETV